MINRLLNWVINQRISLLLYIGFFFFIVISIFNPFFIVLAIFVASIGLIYDTLTFFKNSHGKYWEKFLFLGFAIIAYFSYIASEAVAKHNIYDITKVNPEMFGSSLAILKGLYFLPTTALFSLAIFGLILVITIVLFWIPVYLEEFGFNNRIVKNMKQKLLHIFLYTVIAFTLTMTYLLNSEKIYQTIFGKNYISHILLFFSYLPNHTCSNISEGTYIKFLDSDLLSVNTSSDKNETTFNVMKCKKIIKNDIR